MAAWEGARILRDKAHLTRLLLLRELHARPGTSLSDAAGSLGITVQATSNHAKALVRSGQLAKVGRGFEPTSLGVQALQEGLGRLKRNVDEAIAPLARIEAASARAATPVRAGERVLLFMEGGELVARASKESGASSGRAVAGAMTGEEVVVRDLAGVVELRPGRLFIVRVPAPVEGGSGAVNVRALRAQLKAASVPLQRVGAHGLPARLVVERLQLPVAFEFAAPAAAFNAAELGLDVALFVSRDLLNDALEALDALNARTLSRVAIHLVEEPRA